MIFHHPLSLGSGDEIGVVMEYKCLGLIIDHKLSRDKCADVIFLRRLNGAFTFLEN